MPRLTKAGMVGVGEVAAAASPEERGMAAAEEEEGVRVNRYSPAFA